MQSGLDKACVPGKCHRRQLAPKPSFWASETTVGNGVWKQRRDLIPQVASHAEFLRWKASTFNLLRTDLAPSIHRGCCFITGGLIAKKSFCQPPPGDKDEDENVLVVLLSWRNWNPRQFLPTSKVPLLPECCGCVRLGTYYISKFPVFFSRLHYLSIACKRRGLFFTRFKMRKDNVVPCSPVNSSFK